MKDEDGQLPEEENNDQESQFSNDPEEQLRIENDLLRLQLQAETGANMESFSEIPPEVENAFLNHILSFERQLDQVAEQSIFEIIGSPAHFKKEEELDDAEVGKALEEIEELLFNHDIEVSYGAFYPDRVKYTFLTEELFRQETQAFDIPDMISHFIYEEFHPNHRLSLEELGSEFLNRWLQQDIPDDARCLSETWERRQGGKIPNEKILQKIKHYFEAYPRFENGSYAIKEITFDLNPDKEAKQQGTGSVKGFIQYDAIMESGEPVSLSGDFILITEMIFDYWTIKRVELPQFKS